MARVTIEDCLGQMPNRFELVEVAAQRARKIADGSAKPMVETNRNNKSAVVALREIAEGHIGMNGAANDLEHADFDLSDIADLDEN